MFTRTMFKFKNVPLGPLVIPISQIIFGCPGKFRDFVEYVLF